MATIHAWFSADYALVMGSSVYRKTSGTTVNVTRTNPDRKSRGSRRYDETYVGEVVRPEDGGCVHPISRVRGVSD
jgi:hypothetical protein